MYKHVQIKSRIRYIQRQMEEWEQHFSVPLYCVYEFKYNSAHESAIVTVMR